MFSSCRDFFSTLKTGGVDFCSWKSNAHLAAGLAGKTDLDLLVREEHAARFRQLAAQFRLLPVSSPPFKRADAIEDYLGFDDETGKLLHYHVHYRLILGNKHVKCYRFPAEDLVFATMEREGELPTISPELELLLLVLRTSLKISGLDLIVNAAKSALGVRTSFFSDRTLAEFDHLMGGTERQALLGALRESRAPLTEADLEDYLAQVKRREIRVLTAAGMRRRVTRFFGGHRSRSAASAWRLQCERLVRSWLDSRALVAARRKTPAAGGKLIAVIGADGSGKSTLVRELETWLAWKMDVQRAYLGIPKSGLFPLLRRAMHAAQKLGLGSATRFLEGVFWVALARHRARVYAGCLRMRAKGYIVVADRYPLFSLGHPDSAMDGPRLGSRAGEFPAGAGRAERAWYERIGLPDLTLVLNASYQTLRQRKPESEPHEQRIKGEAARAIGPGDRTVVLDADRDCADVLSSAKRAVWRCLAPE